VLSKGRLVWTDSICWWNSQFIELFCGFLNAMYCWWHFKRSAQPKLDLDLIFWEHNSFVIFMGIMLLPVVKQFGVRRGCQESQWCLEIGCIDEDWVCLWNFECKWILYLGNLKSSIIIQHQEVLKSYNLVLTFFLVVMYGEQISFYNCQHEWHQMILEYTFPIWFLISLSMEELSWEVACVKERCKGNL
jgi:hypothetical protein